MNHKCNIYMCVICACRCWQASKKPSTSRSWESSTTAHLLQSNLHSQSHSSFVWLQHRTVIVVVVAFLAIGSVWRWWWWLTIVVFVIIVTVTRFDPSIVHQVRNACLLRHPMFHTHTYIIQGIHTQKKGTNNNNKNDRMSEWMQERVYGVVQYSLAR
jgi:hypothetical protein